jgi:Eukaryotic protein of unknown function (DUF866)
MEHIKRQSRGLGLQSLVLSAGGWFQQNGYQVFFAVDYKYLRDDTLMTMTTLPIIGVDFHAKSVGRTGTVFESIDLSEKEWTEYDEEGDLSVSVMELEYKIE